MKTILVSGASGIVGYGILRSLKRSGKQLNLIGTTIYEDSVANAFCDTFVKAIPTNDPFYLDWLLNTIRKYNINLLIPGIEADLYKWTDHISEIQQSGARIALNNIDLIALTKDKWKFYERLLLLDKEHAIESSLVGNYDTLAERFGLPFLLKPRRGFGSKGIVSIDNEVSFQSYQKDIGEKLMAQPIVGSLEEEYTSAAFCDATGSPKAYMTLRRKLSKDGFTEKATVVEIDDLKKVVSKLCGSFRPIGPTNFQFRRHNDTWKLLEINPRISSSTSIRTAFGYNESLMTVEYYLENKIPGQPEIKRGRAVRYSEDFIFYEDSTDF